MAELALSAESSPTGAVALELRLIEELVHGRLLGEIRVLPAVLVDVHAFVAGEASQRVITREIGEGGVSCQPALRFRGAALGEGRVVVDPGRAPDRSGLRTRLLQRALGTPPPT